MEWRLGEAPRLSATPGDESWAKEGEPPGLPEGLVAKGSYATLGD